MSVVKMKKIKLVGISDYKDDILNAIHKEGCVELTATKEVADTFVVSKAEELSNLQLKHAKILDAVSFLEECADKAKGQAYKPDQKAMGIQLVDYAEFSSVAQGEERVFETIDEISALKKQLAEGKTSIMQINTLSSSLKPYEMVKAPFNKFKSTKWTVVYFGTVKGENVDQLKNAFAQFTLSELEIMVEGQITVVCAYSHLTEAEEVEKKLNEFGFGRCAFEYDVNAKTKIAQLKEQEQKLLAQEKEIIKRACEYCANMRELKVFADYYKFLIEKQTATDEFRHTKKTFILEGFLPFDKTDIIKEIVQGVTTAVFIQFTDPEEGDTPPTLIKNRNPVKQTEFVTDMYSVPNYKESDPNKIVFFFFMLFMGVIMADVGYGVLMICAGLFLARRIKVDNGTRRLWYVIAISGVSAIVFGLLFNSVFGAPLPYKAPLPNPVPKGGNTDGLMTILLLCLGLGVLHIAVGYLFNAINAFRKKDILGGIVDGLIWFIFMIGIIFAAFNFLVNYLMPEAFKVMNPTVKSFFNTMQLPGIIMIAFVIFMAIVGACIREKGFGKFTKSFGAVYGIINILSDVLSYARLFGLMLSGMIIASTFNDMGLSIMAGGGVGYVLGALVMVVGHVFNIAMGVLGAYIHNSRLQYIEFFGKFYSGEGEKFTPLGTKFDYIYITDIQKV